MIFSYSFISKETDQNVCFISSGNTKYDHEFDNENEFALCLRCDRTVWRKEYA